MILKKCFSILHGSKCKVFIFLSGITKKTAVVKGELNPTWNEVSITKAWLHELM